MSLAARMLVGLVLVGTACTTEVRFFDDGTQIVTTHLAPRTIDLNQTPGFQPVDGTLSVDTAGGSRWLVLVEIDVASSVPYNWSTGPVRYLVDDVPRGTGSLVTAVDGTTGRFGHFVVLEADSGVRDITVEGRNSNSTRALEILGGRIIAVELADSVGLFYGERDEDVAITDDTAYAQVGELVAEVEAGRYLLMAAAILSEFPGDQGVEIAWKLDGAVLSDGAKNGRDHRVPAWLMREVDLTAGTHSFELEARLTSADPSGATVAGVRLLLLDAGDLHYVEVFHHRLVRRYAASTEVAELQRSDWAETEVLTVVSVLFSGQSQLVQQWQVSTPSSSSVYLHGEDSSQTTYSHLHSNVGRIESPLQITVGGNTSAIDFVELDVLTLIP